MPDIKFFSSVILSDTRAAQPAATSVCPGTLYHVTDEGVTERSDGATWADYSTTPGGAANSIQFNDSNAFGGFGSWDGTTLAIPGSANSLELAGSTTGNPVTITATGSDSPITIRLTPKTDALFFQGGGWVSMPQAYFTLLGYDNNDFAADWFASSDAVGVIAPWDPTNGGMSFAGTSTPVDVDQSAFIINGIWNVANASDPLPANASLVRIIGNSVNVGIGSPPEAILFGVSDDYADNIFSVVTNGSDVDNSRQGKVGINTILPTAALHVAQGYAGQTTGLRVESGNVLIDTLTPSRLVATDADKNLVSTIDPPIQTAVGPTGWIIPAVKGDPALGSESLSEPNFATNTKWTAAGDVAFSAGAAVYTFSAGTGSLTQITADLATALIGDTAYVFTYDTSGDSGDVAATITTGIAEDAVSLPLAAGSHTVYLSTKSSPGNFVISFTASSGGVTLDNVSLKRVIFGNAFTGTVTPVNSITVVNGIVTAVS